jgi:excisionase family DNA binding protein
VRAPDRGALPPDLEGDRLIRPAQLAALLSCSRSHVYRLVRAGELPPPTRLSYRVSGWRAGDVVPIVRRWTAGGSA